MSCCALIGVVSPDQRVEPAPGDQRRGQQRPWRDYRVVVMEDLTRFRSASRLPFSQEVPPALVRCSTSNIGIVPGQVGLPRVRTVRCGTILQHETSLSHRYSHWDRSRCRYRLKGRATASVRIR